MAETQRHSEEQQSFTGKEGKPADARQQEAGASGSGGSSLEGAAKMSVWEASLAFFWAGGFGEKIEKSAVIGQVLATLG